MINDLVKENERIDDLQNGYYIIQDPRKFCFGMDAVLFIWVCQSEEGREGSRYGNGNWYYSVLLASKTVGEHFWV